jgi:hypothetical protein
MSEMLPCYIGLVHYPVVNKHGEEVTSAVTNLDIHDISRTARTYGIKNYFIITPLQAQHALLQRILSHWETDASSEYNPDRVDALKQVSLVTDIEKAKDVIRAKELLEPFVVVTGAKIAKGHGDCHVLKEVWEKEKRPLLILFGTAHGLSSRVVQKADFSLKHLAGAAEDGYNHLSVRSAVAIYCDRLLSSNKESRDRY